MSAKHERPIEQPGGKVLCDLEHVLLRWVRGDIYSDEAFDKLGDVIIESAGWKRDET